MQSKASAQETDREIEYPITFLKTVAAMFNMIPALHISTSISYLRRKTSGAT